MRSVLFLLMLSALFENLLGQELTLTGYVFDENKNPIVNASIELTQGNFRSGAITDSLGVFRLKVKPGKVKISVKHLSFKELDEILYVYADTSIFLEMTNRVIKFDEITISATRYQSNISKVSNFVEIIDGETFQITSYTSIADILKRATSVYVRDYGGTPSTLKTISLRGTGSEHTVFLLNGIRISSYQNGVLDLSLVPLDVIERIEIIHSNLSSLYGADAIGGVVNIITKTKSDDVGVNFGFDSFGLRKFNARVSGGIGNLSYLSSFSRTYGSGNFSYKYRFGKEYITLRRKNSHFSNSDIYFVLSNQSLSISAFYVRSNRGIPAQVTKFDPTSTAWQFDEDLNVSISTLKTFANLVLKATAMFKSSYQRYVNNDLIIAGSGIDSYLRNLFYSAVLNSIFKFGSDFIVSSGIETSFGIGEGNSFQKARRLNLAVFLTGEKEFKMPVLPTFRIYPMLRNDYFSDFGNRFVYKFGVNFETLRKPSLNVKFSYGTSFRAPTFNDLYWHGAGNRELKPEKSKGYDVGFIMIANLKSNIIRETRFEVAFFDLNIDDRIVWLPSKENQSIWRPINIDRVRSTGFQISGEVNLFKSFLVSGNFSAVRSIRVNKRRDDDATHNKFLIYIPTSSGNIRAELNFDKIFFVLYGNYVGIRYTTEMNDRWLQPYFVVDFTTGLNLQTRFVNSKLKITVKNIFNENYETMVGYPMPLRSFMFEISALINSNKNKKDQEK
ncbi:MAG: TonB-dependent receptor [Candidatus Kryptonium sp.]|nr:TonB-dependent receptor [Candidatus Kryptonium sp.]